MQLVICAIAKNEHLYINQWVKYYLGLGVDHIFIYDNDDLNSPYIGNFIDKVYINNVTIYNCRGLRKKYLQHEIYNKFYHSHRFAWVFFVDIDEYLVGVNNIKDLLNTKCNQVRIKWRLFGDDEQIERDTSIPLLDYFKQEKHDNRLEFQGKSIVRGGLAININSCHYVKYLNSCFPSGRKCQADNLAITNYVGEKVFINHYMTKTLSEFVKQKLGRGDAVWKDRSITLDYYWGINNRTTEKENWLKNMGLE